MEIGKKKRNEREGARGVLGLIASKFI